MATSAQIDIAARGDHYRPWGLTNGDDARSKVLLHLTYTDAAGAAVEREERWHAALKVRQRYRRPESWLDCLGLTDVPTSPEGWCTCTPTPTERAL